jgi:hypothetical protein
LSCGSSIGAGNGAILDNRAGEDSIIGGVW